MNQCEHRPLASLPTDVLQDAYRRAKEGDSDEEVRVAREISRELIRRNMQAMKGKPNDD
jgi:hypothetical protein